MERDSPHCAVRGLSCPLQSLPFRLPKREVLPLFLTRSDLGTCSATGSLGGGDLGMWHSGSVPWTHCVFLLSASLCCHYAFYLEYSLCTCSCIVPSYPGWSLRIFRFLRSSRCWMSSGGCMSGWTGAGTNRTADVACIASWFPGTEGTHRAHHTVLLGFNISTP